MKYDINPGGCGDIQADDGRIGGRIHLFETAQIVDAGIIDQDVDRQSAAPERRRQLGKLAVPRQIGCNGDDLDAVAFDQFVAQHLKLVHAARDQHEIMAGAGEAPCQRLADAHRGTGNENGFRGFSLPMTPPKFGGRIRR